MKPLSKFIIEGILNIDDTINQANIGFENANKIITTIYNFVNELIDDKYSWSCLTCRCGKHNDYHDHNEYKYIDIQIHIDYKNRTNKIIKELYDHTESVMEKYNKQLKDIKNLANIQKESKISFKKRPKKSYGISGGISYDLVGKKVTIPEYVFSTDLEDGLFHFYFGDIYVDKIKELLLKKNISGDAMKKLTEMN